MLKALSAPTHLYESLCIKRTLTWVWMGRESTMLTLSSIWLWNIWLKLLWCIWHQQITVNLSLSKIWKVKSTVIWIMWEDQYPTKFLHLFWFHCQICQLEIPESKWELRTKIYLCLPQYSLLTFVFSYWREKSFRISLDCCKTCVQFQLFVVNRFLIFYQDYKNKVRLE